MAGGALFDRPARPHPRLVPEDLGGGSNSLSALVTGSLTSATGSLLQVTGVTQESDPGGQNSYSLQLNTNRFNNGAALCAGQAGCFEWQQFIRENHENTPPCVPPPSKEACGAVHIQYWLVNHTSPCPDQPANFPNPWQFFKGVPPGPGVPGQAPGCFIDGNKTPVTVETPLEDLEGMRVTGSTSPSAQSVKFEVLSQMFTAQDPEIS